MVNIMGLMSFIKSKASNVAGEVKKVTNRDLMEAIVGGSMLVAAADGSIDDDEIIALDGILSSNPALADFGSEIGKEIKRCEDIIGAGFRIGKLKILREIADIKNNPEHAEEVFVVMITIAEADGEVDDSEMAILREVGNVLGLKTSDYGL